VQAATFKSILDRKSSIEFEAVDSLVKYKTEMEREREDVSVVYNDLSRRFVNWRV
jgi:hypothetical protein